MIVRGQLTQRGGTVTKALVALAVSAVAILLLTAAGCGGGGAAQTGATATTAPGGTISGTGPASTASASGASGDGAASEAAVTIVDAPSSSPLDLPHLGSVSYSIDDTVTGGHRSGVGDGRYGPQAHR